MKIPQFFLYKTNYNGGFHRSNRTQKILYVLIALPKHLTFIANEKY